MNEGEKNKRSRAVVHQPFVSIARNCLPALGTRRKKFAKIFRFNPVATSIIGARDGRFVEVNPEFCRMTGYTREEAIGRTPLELGVAWPESSVSAESAGDEGNNREAMIRQKSGESRIRVALL